MHTIVVFDGGYGGELFADRLKEELPFIKIIRVIDWRNADKLLNSAKTARKVAKDALLPYIGNVDLIIFANHLLTATSLKFFQRKYKNQKFVGFNLKQPDTFVKHDILILTTKAMSKTITYRNFIFRLKRSTRTLTLDDWPNKIDDGELGFLEIKNTIQQFLSHESFCPQEVILACAQLNDVKKEIRRTLGWNIKTYDSFNDTIRKACKILGIRGGNGKKTS